MKKRTVIGIALVAAFGLTACGGEKTTGESITVDPVEAACSALEPGTPCAEAVDQFTADIAALQTQAHDRYAAPEAVAAMGVEDPTNPLNHARYTDAECVAAVNAGGVLASSIDYDPSTSSLFASDVQNALDEVASILDRTEAGPHFTDTDALAAVTTAGYVTGPHFSAGDAVAAMGSPNNANSLNHTRYMDVECLDAVAGAGYVTGVHYTDAEAVAAMGAKANANALNHDRYTDADAVTAVGPHPSGTFCARTASSYTGNIGGWSVVKGLCETACGSSSAHICGIAEIERSWQLGVSVGADAWIASGHDIFWDGVATTLYNRSCRGWKSEALTEYSSATEGSDPADGWIKTKVCTTSYALACCD